MRHHRSGRAAAPSQRQLRVGELVRHALAEILARGEVRDPELAGVAVTVTEVKVGPDAAAATAFVVPLGGARLEETVAALNRAAPFLRGRLAREVELRRVPTLTFAADTTFDYAGKVDAMLGLPEVRRDLDRTGEG
jgi:ribosome-binding factor A